MSSRIVSRAAALGALTASGQLIIVGTLPMYSRIFDPAAYGEYVIFVGAVGVVGVFAGVRYESAVVLPRSDKMAIALSALVMLIASAAAVLVAAATLILSMTRASAEWSPIDFGYGLAIATAVGALQRCLSSWCIRRGRFILMGAGQFLFCLVTVVAQFSFVRMTGQFPALVWGYVCALAVQTACLGMALRAKDFGSGLAASSRWMRVVAYRYRRFPTYMVGYALASSARDRLIQIALGIGAGAAMVGRFGLAYRVVFAPNSLIYSAVSPLFFGFASRGSRLDVGRFAAGAVEAIFVMLIVPYAAFAIEAPTLTDELLSEKWRGTGPFLRVLTAPALLLAATCWLDRAFDSFRRQNIAFALEVSFTVISVSLVAVLSRWVDALTVIEVFSLLGVAYYWIYFLMTFLACGFPLADFRRACVAGVLASIVALALGTAVHQFPLLALRLPGYALTMAVVILGWLKFGRGAETVRLLLNSRIGGLGAEPA
jgi:O-antigen/teichoic acid export membrane protein